MSSLDETKKYLGKTFKKNTQNIIIWAGFFTVSLLVYSFLSSGDFSFLLTYSAFMKCFAFGLLNYKIFTSSSVKGISLKTLQLFLMTFIARLLSIFRHQGYLPFDKTGDWFYHVVEVISFLSISLALYAIFIPMIATYDEKYDRFGSLYLPSEFGITYLAVPCILLAILFHPSLNREWLSDTCWTLSMYLEAVAMIPQIYMFQKQASDQGGFVEALIGHTVFALGFSRIFELIFWLASFRELADLNGSRLPGYIVLISQLGQVVIMADFFYYYFKSISKGLPMQLPTTSYGAGLV